MLTFQSGVWERENKREERWKVCIMNYCVSSVKRAPPSEMPEEVLTVSVQPVNSVQHGVFAEIQQMALEDLHAV